MPTLILENAKWIWQREEIEQFRQLWADGWNVKQIAALMKENPDDVALLVMDQAQKGKIEVKRK
ncbi:hypothetical protein [Atopococcus tabaci]|uniref:hypothetical protein n=1 Tax=Atopococcus tabaci TaxID=269774 RepID=UPI00240902D4|nr:hypothetical protein [Atopococcus tabaci]